MSQAAPTLHSKLASRTGPFGIVAIIAQETAAIICILDCSSLNVERIVT